MNENKSAKRCGAEQLIAILAHGRMESEVHDYVKHVLKSPSLSEYTQGDDIPEELEGVEGCLTYVRKAWPKVGTADELVLQLQSQLPDDGNAEPFEEPSNKEPDATLDDNRPVVNTPAATEEDPGQPDSFKSAKPKSKPKLKPTR